MTLTPLIHELLIREAIVLLIVGLLTLVFLYVSHRGRLR